ncbi:MAG: zinc metalloprotease HtpX [Candidatus Nanoarchaeia archaeon]
MKTTDTLKIWKLKIRLFLIMTLFFGIIYGLVSMVSYVFGVVNFFFYAILAIVIIFFQYLLGPSIINLTMRVKYVSEKEEPDLYKMIKELAEKADIPMPKIGISSLKIPNAFAFGRWLSDGRVCVTQGILDLLDKKELKAVLGHEISHLKHRDVLVMTLLSTVPMLAWFLARSSFYSSNRRNSGMLLIGLLAFVIYIITNLLVLYVSRIREYYADAGSLKLGNSGHYLATALYKLVHGSAKSPKEEIKFVEGAKAFFVNDVSKAHDEILQLADLDLDKSGTIDPHELKLLKEKHIKLTPSEKLLEVLSTHPNMLKRIKYLAELS